MIKLISVFFFLQFVHCFALLLSSNNEQQYNQIRSFIKRSNTPPPPPDDFFNFDDDPFAKNLANTFSSANKKGNHSPSGSIDKPNNKDKTESVARSNKTKRPYVVVPRKDESEYSNHPDATRSRRNQNQVRADPKKREAYLEGKKNYARAKRDGAGRKRIYKLFNRPLTPMPTLVKLEKSGKLDESQAIELAHQRAHKYANNLRYREKRKKLQQPEN